MVLMPLPGERNLLVPSTHTSSSFEAMFDIHLRSIKDRIFDPCCKYVPAVVTPLQITGVAFLSGLLSCYAASCSLLSASIILWLLNRALDCLDGALARHRKTASDLGGFLDLLGDFIVYSILPISIAAGQDADTRAWMAVATLEATFHVNNFVLFYVAAIAEKRHGKEDTKTKELTSVMMRPALIEGMESGVLFTTMLLFPNHIELLCWAMAVLVTIGIVQRTLWLTSALSNE